MRKLVYAYIMLCFIIAGLTACSEDKNKSNITGRSESESIPKRPSPKGIESKEDVIYKFSQGVQSALNKKFKEDTGKFLLMNNDVSDLVEKILSEKAEEVGDWAKLELKDEDKISSLKKDMEKITLECTKENGQLETEKFREEFEHLLELKITSL